MQRLRPTAAVASCLLFVLLLCCALTPGVHCEDDDLSSSGLSLFSSSAADLPSALPPSSSSWSVSSDSPVVTSLSASKSASLAASASRAASSSAAQSPSASQSSASQSSTASASESSSLLESSPSSESASHDISVLLLGGSLLTDHGLATVLLPALYAAAGCSAVVDTSLLETDNWLPIVSLEDEAPSHSAAGSTALSQLPQLPDFDHVVLQDSPLQPFDAEELLPAYVTAVADLYALTSKTARLHLLVPPPPCANVEQPGCWPEPYGDEDGDYGGDYDGDKDSDSPVPGQQNDAAAYGGYYSNHTLPFYSEALAALRGKKAGITGGVDLLPVGPALLPAAKHKTRTQDWVNRLYADYGGSDTDSSLLTADGSYLIACGIFAVTTGISPVGAPIEQWMGLDGDDAAVSQQAAEDELNAALRLDKKPLLRKLDTWLEVEEPKEASQLTDPLGSTADGTLEQQPDPLPPVVLPPPDDGSTSDPELTATGEGVPYFTRFGLSPPVVLLIAAIVVCALWFLLSLYRRVSSLWTQKQLRKRRGYDDREVADFPKEPTQGYAFDDGL